LIPISLVVTIKQIQEQSGANVHVPKSANIDNPTVRTLQVTCPNLDGANLAKQLIEDVLKTKPGYGSNGGGMNSYQSQVSLQVSVPDKDVGLCIGRGGCVIKYMQSTTQTRIQIPPTVPNPGDMYRIITVTGPSMEACQQVQSMIHRILAEQSSAGVMAGNHTLQQQQPQPSSSYGSQYATAATTTSTGQAQINQPGYTAEWAAYHAAQQQQQQQQQVQYHDTAAAAGATPAVAATTTATVAATNEYTEPFFRYAYYYGEEAARQYYGAWSPPVGTPNPYGVNPNGITTTPTAGAAAAAAVTTTTAATVSGTAAVDTTTPDTTSTAAATTTTGNQYYSATETVPSNTTTTTTDDAADAMARETSRRHVSNLPAWMTKK
jgi:far upstream element-binding protein